MDRTTRTAVVVGIAVACAAAASLGAYQIIQRMPVREVEVRSLYQVVATQDLTMGTLLTKDHVKLVAWPASAPVTNGFTAVDQVVNRGLIAPIVANEPLTESKLAPLEAGAGLPPSIPEGMRALSVRVNEVIGVAGFVVPGTRVDLLVTIQAEGSKDTMTRAVVSDLQVLTAGTRYDQEKARDGQPIPTSVVTLARHAGRCGEDCAGRQRRLDHVDAAQPARSRADRNAGCAHVRADGSGTGAAARH